MQGQLPNFIASSVVRSTKKGSSHGGLYLINGNSGKYKKVFDLKDESIEWDGNGGDRGLRGIAFYKNQILVATSYEVIFYNQDFKEVDRLTNKYLGSCHEIFISENSLFLSSTLYDSVLEYSLEKKLFVRAYCYRTKPSIFSKYLYKLYGKFGLNLMKLSFYKYDPLADNGPERKDSNHINNVFVKNGSIYFSGTNFKELMKITSGNEIIKHCGLPYYTHNVQFIGENVIFNDTGHERICIMNEKEEIIHLDVPRYKNEELVNLSVTDKVAKTGFARGLCFNEEFIVGGSSPSTISVYSRKDYSLIKRIQLSNDVRNAIHGLEIYPFPIDF